MNAHQKKLDAEQSVKNWFSPASSVGESQDEAIRSALGSLMQLLRNYKWGIITLMLLGCLAGIVKSVSEVPIYQAELTMAVEPSNFRSNQQTMFDPYAYRFYETQYELLKSRSVAERVVDNLRLAERQSIQKLFVRKSVVQALIIEVGAFFGVPVDTVQPVSSNETIENLSEDELQRRRTQLISIVKSGADVSGGNKTNLVRVTFRSTDPGFAAEVANALVDAYIELGLDSQANRSQQTTEWLSRRIDSLKINLDEAQDRLQKFLLEEDMLGSTQTSQITNSELQSLNANYLQARARLSDLAKRYGSRHPKITEARAEVNTAKARLDNKSKTISFSRSKQVELAQLERDVKANEELYEAFLTKFKEADISSSGEYVKSARIVDKALPPGGPVYPNKQQIIITWTLGGLILGVLLAFMREQLDTTFRSGRALEEKLNLPLFGVVQSMPTTEGLVERHYSHDKRSVFSESINHIRTGITYSNVDNPPKVILVTSSVQSEGKTTLASNLAMSYAQLGTTLLIDADLRRPRIKHIVDNGNVNGLVDYVAGIVPLKECVSRDLSEPNLHILNSGTAPPNPLELLASDKFSRVVEALRSKFSYIVIDTAPVLPASDAVVLGQLCDALLMVVQSEKTTFHMVRDAIKRLSASQVQVSGLILSQAQIKAGSPYGYDGYYGYGAYAYVEDDKQPDSSNKA